MFFLFPCDMRKGQQQPTVMREILGQGHSWPSRDLTVRLLFMFKWPAPNNIKYFNEFRCFNLTFQEDSIKEGTSILCSLSYRISIYYVPSDNQKRSAYLFIYLYIYLSILGPPNLFSFVKTNIHILFMYLGVELGR